MKLKFKKVGKSEGHEFRINLEHSHSSGNVEKQTLTLPCGADETVQELIQSVSEANEKSTEIVLQSGSESVSIDLKDDEIVDGAKAKVSISSIQYFYCDCEYTVTY